MAHPEKQLDFDTICAIVKENIFGVEINPEAIKVAAFSIYLAMLNRLSPKTLWQLRKFPYLIFDPKIEEGKQGNNLFLMSSLGKGKFEDNDYELVVGNPPFGTKNLPTEVENYVESRGFAREVVLAFLHRVTKISPNGKIALLVTTKILLNNKSTYQNFRKFLFQKNHVEKVVNLSILGKVTHKQGKKYLPKASVPISIIFYTPILPEEPDRTLEYWAPKTVIKNNIIDGIVIDQTDIKFLPREECIKADTKIWKAAMWGTERDFQLILSFFVNYPSLKFTFVEKGWKKNMGVGFEFNPPRISNLEINKLLHLPVQNLSNFSINNGDLIPINNEGFRTLGNQKAYLKPHLLFKEAIIKGRFIAGFSDIDCSFTNSIYGIHVENEPEFLNLFNGYLNSKLFLYLLFLTSVDWGIERNRVKPNEVLLLPNLCYSLDETNKTNIINLVDKIIKIKKQNLIDESPLIQKLEQKIEIILWNTLNLSENEKILIEDLLDYTLDAFLKKQKSIAHNPIQLSENKLYALYLCKTINEFLDYDEELTVWASVFDISNRIPLNVIILYFNKDKKADVVMELPENQVGQILKQMEEYSYKEHAESIYYRRFFRYSKNDKIYIIKPNEKRFWTRSMAINDADEIIAEVLNP